MADRSTIKGEKGTSFSGAKSALFDHLNKLKKWREDQFEQFRSMQLMQVQETQKNVNTLLQTHKGMLSPNKAKDHQETDDPPQTCNVPNKYDSVKTQEQDASLTGHFERCFSDSSLDASSLFLPNKNASPSHGYSHDEGYRSLEQLLKANTQKPEIKDQKENNTTEKLKRPFLKKGTGLQRYMPITGSRESSKLIKPVKRKGILPQSKLKLKPPLGNTSSPSKEKKHVQFDIPCFQSSPIKDVGHSQDFLLELPIEEPTLNANKGKHPHDSDELASQHSVEVNTAAEACDQNLPSDVDEKNLKDYLSGNISIDSSISQVDSQKEHKELKEFELLEHYAQNNSFNSDSSIVQRILDGEVVKPIKSTMDNASKPLENVHIYPMRHRPVDPITANNTMKPVINKYLKDVQEKKKHLQRLIEEIEPAMASLQKEITASASPEVLSDDDDISSLPVDSNPIKDQEAVAKLDAYDNSSVGSSSNSIMNDVDTSVIAAVGPDPYYLTVDNSHPTNSLGNYQDVNVKTSNDKDMPPEASHDSLLKKKLNQLETEIIFFKEQNVKLAGLQKERDQMILRMQKDQHEFEKWKAQEKKKLEKEIEDERRQLKRQKQTFERYQKLRQDNPTKTERAELNALRQQVEKLQQELKAKNIKWNNDSRLMKSKLTCTENERDSLKRENNRLEEQCQDLLATLKVKLKKQKVQEVKQQKAEENEKTKVDEKEKKKVAEKGKKKVDEKEKKKVMSENDDGVSVKNADTVTESSSGDSVQNATNLEGPHVEETPRDRSSVAPQPQRKVRFNLNPEFQNYDGNLSNQLNESSSTIEPNEPQVIPGYDKEIHCEGYDENDSDLRVLESGFDFREIHHKECIERIYETGEKEFLYSSGTKQCISADGLVEKYFFFNGDIREHFPDKRTAYTYVDGTVETKYPDGLILIEFKNGQIERHYPNQSKEVQYPDGTIHIMYADGTEEMRLQNGTVMIRAIDGTETLEFTNGQKEIRTKTFKRREYPDGAVKILYTSGRQETRYANGRIRIKDRDGKVVVDTKILGLFNSTESSNSN